MSNFQRMVVIPQEEYVQLTAVQNARQPVTQQFYNLENKYQDSDHIKDPYKRLLIQSETLDEMKELKDQMRNNLTLATPKPYLNRAKALFDSMQLFLKFNQRGELMDKEGNAVTQSRVEDLIQHAVRDRRRNRIPEGWSHFLQLMKEHNVPKTALNRDTLDEMDRQPLASAKQEPMLSSGQRPKLTPKLSPKVSQTRNPKRQRKPTTAYLEFIKDIKKRKREPDFL